MGSRIRPLFLAALTAAWAGLAAAQGTTVGFTGFSFDPDQQVEVTADSLTVDQGDGSSVFSGNVVVGQGTMRLGAGELRIEYGRNADGSVSGIERLIASGGVTLAAGQDAAEAREAVYDLASRRIEMTGDVLLTQGPNALSGERLVVNLDAGTGTMEGRVRTVLMPQAGQQQ